jgi:DNA-binding MarR family transcriptional regulator
MLADLEEAGLIRRSPSPDDGRKVVLQLTDSGGRAATDGVRRAEEWVDRAMTATLTPAEIQILAVAGRLLTQLADHPD